MGADPVFEPEPIPDEVLAEPATTQQGDELSGLFLFKPDEGRLLSLYPFVLWEHCPSCEREPLSGLTEEVFLFNGGKEKRKEKRLVSVEYIGVRHALTVSNHPVKERLDEIFEAKRVPPEPVQIRRLTYPVLYGRAESQSEIWLQENIRALRYIPQVGMEDALEAFLRGRKSGFLLLGEAGMGKTNLLCRKVEEWRERGEVVLFYAGHMLQWGGETSDAPKMDHPIEQRLLADLHLAGAFPELVSFLRRENRKLILVVDGINEHPDPAALLRHLCTFIQRYHADGCLKVILSFRTVIFEKVMQALTEGKSEEQK